MLTTAHAQHAPSQRSTYTDDPHGSDDRLLLGVPSQMELAVTWSGRERSFTIAEFSTQEIVVVGFCVDDLDLCLHEACVDFCDGELLDEVSCRVVFRGFAAPGVARLRLVADGDEREELARFTKMLRKRLEQVHALREACVAAACGWV